MVVGFSVRFYGVALCGVALQCSRERTLEDCP
jgi:hypothetical protein